MVIYCHLWYWSYYFILVFTGLYKLAVFECPKPPLRLIFSLISSMFGQWVGVHLIFLTLTDALNVLPFAAIFPTSPSFRCPDSLPLLEPPLL